MQSLTLSRTTGSRSNNGRLAGCTTSHHGVADSSQSGRMWPGAVNRGSSVNAHGYVDRGIEHGTAKFIVDGGRCARVKYDDYDRNKIGSPVFRCMLGKYFICIYTYTYIYIYMCVCVCVCISVMKTLEKILNCNNSFVLFFTINEAKSESNPTGNDL